MNRRSMQRHIVSDAAFTFAELTVVVALLGVMLAVTYTGMKVVYDGRRVSDQQALVARDIGAPLEQVEQSLAQNLVLEQATPYAITALIDRPRYNGTSVEFDNLERHVITATTDGRIVEQVYATDALRQNTGLIRSFTWSNHNANQAQGTPLFVYRDDSGAEIASSATTLTANTRRVDVRVIARYDGRSFEGSRTVFFRNR